MADSPKPPPPHEGKDQQSTFAVTMSSLEAAALATIIEREGASAARVVVTKATWHTTRERDLEVRLYDPSTGWDDEHIFTIRASGRWSDGRYWYDPVPA